MASWMAKCFLKYYEVGVRHLQYNDHGINDSTKMPNLNIPEFKAFLLLSTCILKVTKSNFTFPHEFCIRNTVQPGRVKYLFGFLS